MTQPFASGAPYAPGEQLSDRIEAILNRWRSDERHWAERAHLARLRRSFQTEAECGGYASALRRTIVELEAALVAYVAQPKPDTTSTGEEPA
jgi:hypothetical protein